LNYGHRTQYGRDYITARHERQARRVYQTKRSLRNDPETALFPRHVHLTRPVILTT